MLVNREIAPSKDGKSGEYVLNLRHYAITTKQTGLSRAVKRLNAAEKKLGDKKKSHLPNLGKMGDVSEFFLDPAAGGYTSASETEVDTDAEVEVMESTTRKVLSSKEAQRRKSGSKPGGATRRSGVEKRAVKLIELGPRLKLRMTKVEEGVCGGKVMWHEYITKSQGEVKALDKVWEQRRTEKERRKQEQRENVEQKKKERGGGKKGNGEAEDDEDMDEDMLDDDDDEWDSEGLEGDAEMQLNEQEEEVEE